MSGWSLIEPEVSQMKELCFARRAELTHAPEPRDGALWLHPGWLRGPLMLGRLALAGIEQET